MRRGAFSLETHLKPLPPIETRPRARAFRSRCPPHRKREWQRIGNQIDAAMIFARAHFVNVRVKRAVRLRQRHSVIVKGKRISCPPHYAPPNNDYDPPHHDYEHGFPLIRSLRASTQRSTSVLFSFLLSLLIVAGSFTVRQSKTLSLCHCRVESKIGRITLSVKYWEIILENLRNAGWNCGCMSTTDDKGRPILGCGRRAQRRWTLYCACRSRVACLSRTRIRNSNPPT